MRRTFFSFFLTVIVTILVLNFVFTPVAEMISKRMMTTQVNAYYCELVKGTFYMLKADLEPISEAHWQERIDVLQAQFGYPIGLTTADAADLTAEEVSLANAGKIVVSDDGENFYQRVNEDGPSLLFMGPIMDPELDLLHLYLVLWTYLALMVAVLALFWALPFARRLHHISTAAIEFGDGQFGARAWVPRRSALAPLADAFNRMADHIQELIDAQRELTNAVSHELRTPIARTRFSLEMLGTATKIGDRKHYLAEISKDIDELDALVSESLTYARFDQERLEIDWQPRVLEVWLRQIAKSTLPPHLQIVFECRNRLSPPDREIYCDPRYMARAIGNLIQNAAKHAHSRVEVTLEEKGGACCIHVDDDGAGIAEADRTKVFQAFTRLDDSRSRASGGHGLGLAIVRRVVTWHGGRIWVEQAPLGGARLTLCWPGFTPSVQGEGAGDDAE